jgi:peptide chain release factor 3
VGVLQFDVLTHRLKAEYKVDIRIQPLNYSHARWALPDSTGKLPDPRSLNLTSTTMVVLERMINRFFCRV